MRIIMNPYEKLLKDDINKIDEGIINDIKKKLKDWNEKFDISSLGVDILNDIIEKYFGDLKYLKEEDMYKELIQWILSNITVPIKKKLRKVKDFATARKVFKETAEDFVKKNKPIALLSLNQKIVIEINIFGRNHKYLVDPQHVSKIEKIIEQEHNMIKNLMVYLKDHSMDYTEHD